MIGSISDWGRDCGLEPSGNFSDRFESPKPSLRQSGIESVQESDGRLLLDRRGAQKYTCVVCSYFRVR